jgi:hypothetical protein
MPYEKCRCGFMELADETIADHLAVAFTPDNCVGNDGKVHEELSGRACACGFATGSAGDLEAHLMASFTPDDGTGLDGKRHEARA